MIIRLWVINEEITLQDTTDKKINLKLDLRKMTDQKAEDDIENLEKSAKVDSKMESGGYVDMNPSLTGTSESM